MGDTKPGQPEPEQSGFLSKLTTGATTLIGEATDAAKNILPGSNAKPNPTPTTSAGGKSRRYRKAKASSKKAKRAGSTRRRHHKRK